MIEYKGYVGVFEFDEELGQFHGYVVNTRDVISFYGSSVDELKAEPDTRHIPILLVTARAGVEGTVEGLERGADDYLGKPFAPRELLARVHAMMRLTRTERELAGLNAELEAKVASRTSELLERTRDLERSLRGERESRREAERLHRDLQDHQQQEFV